MFCLLELVKSGLELVKSGLGLVKRWLVRLRVLRAFFMYIKRRTSVPDWGVGLNC